MCFRHPKLLDIFTRTFIENNSSYEKSVSTFCHTCSNCLNSKLMRLEQASVPGLQNAGVYTNYVISKHKSNYSSTMRIGSLLLLLIYIPSFLMAQGEIDNQETVFYNDEKTWSAILGTAGWGINYRQARRVNATKKNLWAIDFVSLNHAKELSLQGSYGVGLPYVYGKKNSVANLRLSVGRQKELFRKIDKGGIAVIWYYMAGASIALQKPVYYNYYDLQTDMYSIEKFTYDPNDPYKIIESKASFFTGISETGFVPGGHVYTGLNFDFGKDAKRVAALEIGIAADVFAKPLDIMALTDNPMYFVQVYMAMRVGKVVDRMKVRQKRTKKAMEKRIKENE